MKLLDLLRFSSPELDMSDCKIHLAVFNGEQDPVDVFLSGDFESWQEFQVRKNFERKYIISLAQMQNKVDEWLFVGMWQSLGVEKLQNSKSRAKYRYRTVSLSLFSEFNGRLILNFQRPGRQSYLNAERWLPEISVSELKRQRLQVEEFPGHENICISKSKLDLIISRNIVSWRAGLSVAGIYLITDTKTGRLYVGSAGGEEGIWQRWSSYSKNGHGGNKDLKRVLSSFGSDYSQNFQYSILETSDTHSVKNILDRESHWKEVLSSRENGYNMN